LNSSATVFLVGFQAQGTLGAFTSSTHQGGVAVVRPEQSLANVCAVFSVSRSGNEHGGTL
jgi:hypothetical protein